MALCKRFWSFFNNIEKIHPYKKRATSPRKQFLFLEEFENRLVPAPIPVATIIPPVSSMIGEQTTFQVSFDNTSITDNGFGPYIDLFLPATGADGAGAAIDDGISFVSANYFGTPINATVINLTNAGVRHPYAVDSNGNPLLIMPPAGFQEGDQLVVLQLPFGSFAPDQIPANISVTASISNLADLGTTLPIRTNAGFQYGADALNNPAVDPTIVGTSSTASITPALFTLRKEYVGPENETATGPNFPRQYRIIVDVANGQTVTNLDLTDILPSNLQFVQVDSVTGGSPVTDVSTPSTNTPGGTLIRRLASVTGTAGTSDAVMTFSFFAPRIDGGSSEVLNSTTGAPATATDDSSTTGNWIPLDPRDPTLPITSDVTPNDHTLTLRSIATQKTVSVVNDVGSSGPTPGDTLEYTIDVQISDYFAFQNVVLSDLLGDGLNFLSGFTPTLTVSELGTTTTTNFALQNFTLAPGFGADNITFRITDQLVTLGQDGILQGANIPSGGTGGPLPQSSPALVSPGTTARIRFRATIKDAFEITPPSGDTTIVPGDTLSNNITVSGAVLATSNLSPTGGTATDTSSANVTIVEGQSVKVVYAVNGSTTFSNPVQVTPGDMVSYRFTVQLPTSSFENLKLVDFLPQPIFDALTVTTFQNSSSATPPPLGVIRFGPADTFHTIVGGVPTVSTNAIDNSFTLDFGSHDDVLNRPSTLDLVFTVQVQADPFADRLFLTNQVVTTQNNSNTTVSTQTGITQIQVTEPTINGIRKGVVSTSNSQGQFTPSTVGPVSFSAPGSSGTRFTGTITSAGLQATPISSNLANVDAGDLVTFAITVENTGSGQNGAFDVTISDTLPVGFAIPTGSAGLNLRVTDGTGAVFSFTNLGGGLFGNGIQLIDPGTTATPAGALDPGKDSQGNTINNGRNIVVITYDLQLQSSVIPRENLINTTTLVNYASIEGGPDFTGTNDPTDTSTVTVKAPTIVKNLVSTEIENASNSRTQVVIGELVNYTVTITIPEGTTPAATIVDTLDSGLAFVQLLSTSFSPSLAFTGSLNNPTVTNSGRIVTFNLNDIVNSDTDNSVSETITLTYQAVVLNAAANQAGTQLNNRARLSYTGGTAINASAPNVTVIKPTVTIDKVVSVDAGGTVGDAGDPVTYTITLRNTGNVDAFDVTLNDPLPTGTGGASLLVNATLASVTDTANLVSSSDFEIIGDNSNGFTLRTPVGTSFDMQVNSARVITLVITGNLPQASTGLITPGQVINNTSDVQWTSLDGDFSLPRSSFNTSSTERTGVGGINNYRNSNSALISIDGQLDKLLASTSEITTTDSNVTIGEIARYRLVYQLPEGSATSLNFLDRLPLGTQFLDDGSARVAFVSNGGTGHGITSTTILDNAAFVTGNETSIVSITPAGVFPTGTITGGPFADGTDPIFDFGNVSNLDNDADQEFVIVEFNAIVLNVSANQAGTSLNNDFIVRLNTTQTGGSSPIVTLTVVEPQASVVKTVSPDVGDAGDVVTFSLVVSNNSGNLNSTAFNARLLDALPSNLLLNLSSIMVTPLGSFTGFTSNSSGNTLDITIDQVAPGESVLVTYSATLTNAVMPGTSITNTANLTYTSLPGPFGTTTNPTMSVVPGISGSNNGERNGDGTGPNSYTGSSQALITTNTPIINKIVASTSLDETGNSFFNPALTDLNIGETVTYYIGVLLNEGSTPLVITDNLPTSPGILEALSAQVIYIGDNISGSALTVGDFGTLSDVNLADGLDDRVVFNFGTVVNSFDNIVNGSDIIIVEVIARVVDLPANSAGDVLVNTGTMDYGTGQVSDTVSVEIVEPVLQIAKTVNDSTVDAGQIVTYTLVVTHTTNSTGPAFDVVVTDPLAAGLALIPGSVTTTSGSVTTGNQNGDTSLSVDIPSLLLGQTATITYQARIIGPPSANAPATGSTVTNTATINYTSNPQTDGRPGNNSSQSTVTLNSNGLSGIVFHDVDRSGILSTGDIRLSNVVITLSGTDNLGNNVNNQITTDAQGAYSFTGLRPGNYQVTQTQPAGFLTNGETAGTPFGNGSPGVNTLAAMIPAGSNSTGQNFNFAEILPASLSGFVYIDANTNALMDGGENGIGNVTLQLAGTDDLGSVIRTTTTNASGAWSFLQLRPGTYTVTEIQPIGFVDFQDQIGTRGGTVGPDAFSGIILDQGQTGSSYNFGEVLPATIQGNVYVDFNLNGRKDNGEVGIAGVPVSISGTAFAGTIFARPLLASDIPGGLSHLTGSNGSWEFTMLPPGDYSIEETQPSGYMDGQEENTDPNNPGISISNDRFSGINASQAETIVMLNFGEIASNGSIAGTVYVDLNNNGNRDFNETGIPGTTVSMTGVDIRGITVNATTTSDSQGNFIFGNLFPGTYRLLETQPIEYYDGLDTAGTAGGIALNDDLHTIQLGINQAAVNYQFGELGLKPGFISKRNLLASSSQSVTNTFASSNVSNQALVTGQQIFNKFTAIGVDAGGGPLVTVTFANGTHNKFFAYSPFFTGGVRVATGDINGDGIAEIITGAGPGGGPQVNVYTVDPSNGTISLQTTFFAFNTLHFTGGLFVAAGNTDNDIFEDIIIGAGSGGGPRVQVYSGTASGVNASAPANDFFVYNPNFTGGVVVTSGDRTGDGIEEVITAPASNGGYHIRSFNCNGTGTNPNIVDNFFAFNNTNARGGLSIAAGQLNNGAIADLVIGTTNSEFGVVLDYNASGIQASPFAGFQGTIRSGVAKDGSGQDFAMALAGPGGGPRISVFSTGNTSLNLTDSLFALNPGFTGGLFGATTLP